MPAAVTTLHSAVSTQVAVQGIATVVVRQRMSVVGREWVLDIDF
jgi:hypothetical protein